MKKRYALTMYACFVGYVAQAIVNNFVPLLFVTFQKTYNIPLTQISAIIAINFAVQLTVDALSAKFIDKIGYRATAIIAGVCNASGLALLSFLPDIMGSAFGGIVIAVVVYAMGGGLTEVIISPIMEACPTKNKEKAMSLLHSFYCWGHMAVVLFSTLFFALFGIENWRILATVWAAVPAINVIMFVFAPIYSLEKEGESAMPLRKLLSKKVFWIIVLMMICAGAAEQAVSQWASAFAETGLGVSKTLGDLLGPMMFALTMGISRAIFGAFGDKMNLNAYMIISGVLCVFAYCLISLVPVAAIGLVGCALCGFSVGIMWPGTFSRATVLIKGGGTGMFALFALAGDLGCASGPALAGFVSGIAGDNLRAGILAAIVFPVAITVVLLLMKNKKKDGETADGRCK